MLDLDGRPASRVVLRRMTEAVAHRGPDGSGTFVDGAVGLGHRRLAIIDLTSAGHQPMSTPDGRYTLIYNGELYNHEELRAELQSLGARFRSQSDTEVILQAFAAWGIRSLSRFNGMFALALWDREERQLTLARDRFGVKPLYFATAGRTLIFGSEIKALLAHVDFNAKVDREALVEYLTFQNFFTTRTLFRDVHLLGPGRYLRARLPEGVVSTTTWWDWDFSEDESPATDGEYEEELARLFQQAVQRQMVADVDIATYLSGGMDSGSITAVASAQVDRLNTFTVGFDRHSASGLELNFDEREASEFMSYRWGTTHYEMVLKSGDMERCMRDLVWHLEEPRVGQSYPNFYAASLASKFNKVVLAGTGGDELFGGYPWRYYRAVVNTDFEDYIDKYYLHWQRLIANQDLHRVLEPIWHDVSGVWTRDIFRDVFAQRVSPLTTPEQYVNHSLYLEARTFLHGLLVVEDKLSMAHGLETRVPFLDNDLVDFAQRLPVRLKLGNLDEVVRMDENDPGHKSQRFFEKTRDGKLLLRKAMGRHVPEEISGAVKQGFSAPDASWFRGESIDFVRRTLLRGDAQIWNLLSYDATRELIDEHLSGHRNRRLMIWSLLYLEHWLQIFEPTG